MDSNLQSALFYTMSTIAQTLSAAMGLLGAIVLFALQETARSTERAAKKLTEVPHETMSPLYLNHLYARRSFRDLAKHYGDLLQPGASSATSSEGLVHFSTLMWELDHDQALRKSFWTALLASGIVISFALICCALAPQLSADQTVGRAVLGGATLGTVGCMVLYGFLLRVISFALICCALAPQLSADQTVGRLVLGGATFGTVGCMVLYGFLLRVMFRSTPQEPIPPAVDSGSRR